MEAMNQNVHLIQTASGQILDVVQQVCDTLQILSLKRSTDVCRSLVHKNPLIDVAILGQFKAGKSSFLNSLIGRRLLPVGVIPVTTVITRTQSIHTRTNIEKYLDRFKRPLHDKLVDTLQHEMPQWRGNLWKLTRRYEEWLRENMIVELDEISAKEHKHFFGTLMKAHAGLDRYLESFRALLGANIKRILGVKMAPAEWKLEVTPPARPDISIGQVFLFHFDLLWFLIPMAIFRGHFERHFVSQLANQVYVNTSRLAAQWEERINRAIEEMRKQAANYIHDEMTTIDALLSQTPGRTEDIRRLMADLETVGHRLTSG